MGDSVTDPLKAHITAELSRIYGKDFGAPDSPKSHVASDSDISVKFIDRNSESAADQTAYHDFDNLQIAFDSVWSEAFDSEVKDLFTKFYNDVVGDLEKQEGYLDEDKDALIANLKQILTDEQTDFRLIISELNEAANIMGTGVPVPDELFMIGILREGKPDERLRADEVKAGWNRLSVEQQNKIIRLLERFGKNPKVNIDSYLALDDNQKRSKILDILNPDPKTEYGAERYLEQLAKSIKTRTWNGYIGQSLYDIWVKEKGSGWREWRDNFYNQLSHQISNNPHYVDVDKMTVSIPEHHGIDWNVHEWPGDHHEKVEFNYADYIYNAMGESEGFDKSSVVAIFHNPQGILSRTDDYIRQLNERLLEPYSFKVFAPNSVNYGIITTYRQEWKPGNWQVGDLVSTIPLTPGEKRKYSKKLKVKKTRAEKEIDKSVYNRSDESSYVSKAHAEIIGKSKSATNFSTSVKGNMSYKVGVVNGDISNTTGFKEDQATESARTKKSIRESTQKAKNEYKNERSLEISTTDTFDYEESSSGEISNPNNEITVTYLFYELERQYRISEHLHKLTPVILVAFEVPEPHEVDEDWLFTHEWILRRILLDDDFNEALDYLREGIVGDKINYEAAKGHYQDQKKIVQEVSGNVESLSLLKASLQEQLNLSTDNQNRVEFNNRRRSGLMNLGVVGALFNPAAWPVVAGAKAVSDAAGTGDPYDAEYYEAERKAYESRLNLTNEELRTGLAELAREENALEKAKNQMMVLTNRVYTKRNLINQLRIHVKQNILYYMQGIWAYEPPDQRYFRLYDKTAYMPVPEEPVEMRRAGANQYLMNQISWYASANPVQVTLPKPSLIDDSKKLHEVADLDNLIGFKGNYAIFPLRSCTYITDFMMRDYVNDILGLGDPDVLNNFRLEELEKMYHELENDPREELRESIKELITAKLTQPIRDNELFVVPTGQLYIEALPGKHALLEDFKLKHRALDVEKVREELREAQIENLRKSARLLQGDYEDGDVEKRIQVEGINRVDVDVQD